MAITVNDKNYKVLPDYVRLIQGDGISRHTLGGIIDAILARGWSLDNVAFGSGGGLLQSVDRDTQRFAIKCSHVVVDGKGQDVYKYPASDPTKTSKRGRLKLIKEKGCYKTVSESTVGQDELQLVFQNGEIKSHTSLDEVRKIACEGKE